MKAYKSIIFLLLFQSVIYSCKNKKEYSQPKFVEGTFKINSDTILFSTKCHEIIFDILTTSKRYKQITKGLAEKIIKNGGTSYGINFEGSPNPKQDSSFEYSKTYDFSLHETYPDHNPVIARFTFSKESKQLYELDVVMDTLIPIDFDRSLLLKLNKGCK